MEHIDQRDIDHDGTRYRVRVVIDDDARPYDADCYSPEDIAAWREGRWCYVGVILENSAGEQVAALWGVEYGSLPAVRVTLDTLCDVHPVPDMLASLPTRHMHAYRVAVWTATRDPQRPAVPTELSTATHLGMPVTPLVERWGAWGSCHDQARPDGRTVPTCIVHVIDGPTGDQS